MNPASGWRRPACAFRRHEERDAAPAASNLVSLPTIKHTQKKPAFTYENSGTGRVKTEELTYNFLYVLNGFVSGVGSWIREQVAIPFSEAESMAIALKAVRLPEVQRLIFQRRGDVTESSTAEGSCFREAVRFYSRRTYTAEKFR